MDLAELKAKKKALRLTTNEIAYKAELPYGTVSKVFTGETKNPSYATIEKIEKVIDEEAARVRLEAYTRALAEYLAAHPGEKVDQEEFEREYRKKHNLSDDLIPFANGDDMRIFRGNLALHTKKFRTANDLKNYGEDKRYELINGKIIFNETPKLSHQRMCRMLGKIIDKFIEENNGDCEVFDNGFNVRLDEDDYTLVIPDVFVVCDKSKLSEDALWGAPDWVIEIISESTRDYDYKEKMLKYMSSGVREYWIVDYKKGRIVVYKNQEILEAQIHGINDKVPVGIYDEKLEIDFGKIMKELI